MAHFANIDENNIVVQVIVVHNDVLLDEDGVEQESLGASFCSNLLSHLGGSWVQTSYNNTFRGIFAGSGMTYDESNDIFVAGPEVDYPDNSLGEPLVDNQNVPS
jgi:hypothetical protein|tara:strand:- start:495 stop:806 length:312 start_codon:yes stop_codon:yes gene_type:complete